MSHAMASARRVCDYIRAIERDRRRLQRDNEQLAGALLAAKTAAAALRDEVAMVRGAMAADDARLRAAERRVYADPDLTFGCDAADHLAEQVLALRDEIQQMRPRPQESSPCAK